MPTHTAIDPKKLAIGRRIAEARKKLRLSQHGLALKLGVTANAVTQWETGRTVPDTAKFQQVAECLGVSPEWLLTGDDPDERQKAQTRNELDALTALRAMDPQTQATALDLLAALVKNRGGRN